MREIHRFHQMMIESRGDGPLPIFRLTVPCDGNDDCVGDAFFLPQTVRNVETVHSRQADIEENRLGEPFARFLQRVQPVMRKRGLVTFACQQSCESACGIDIIVDDQDAAARLR